MSSLHTLDSQLPHMDCWVIIAPLNSPLFPIIASSSSLFSDLPHCSHTPNCNSSGLFPKKLAFASKITGCCIVKRDIHQPYILIRTWDTHFPQPCPRHTHTNTQHYLPLFRVLNRWPVSTGFWCLFIKFLKTKKIRLGTSNKQFIEYIANKYMFDFTHTKYTFKNEIIVTTELAKL